ncbi:DNA polymerase III subunit delta [Mesoplasma syrphidae]|uniref:DNA polymerase III subunit delta n=1 Tax=Mesoplasma syrphidae TaxID=225999 RepID=A0A2K9CA70_9MOLU|nr:hypothetical protein [Mesoplasma syrphidae]AUF83905.1 DNA polymerase III subunit delta [Mesoplasma syrphidae]
MTSKELVSHLKKLYKNGRLYNSIILSSKNQVTNLSIADEIVRYIFCSEHLQREKKCNNCERVITHKNLDIIYIGDGRTAITKNEVQTIIEKMSMTASENNGNKVYIIANIENLKVEAANSLLKFLEEPPTKTYAILLSNDRSKILQTIRSRCKLFVIQNSYESFEYNAFENLIIAKDKNSYLLAAQEFKKCQKKDLIMMVEESYSRTIIKNFPEFAEATLLLLEDLKYIVNPNLSIDKYFITIAGVV